MALRYSIFLLVLLALPILCNAQDITGSWYAQTATADAEHLLLDLRKDEKGLYGLLHIPRKNIFKVRLDSVGLNGNNEVFLQHKGMSFEFKGHFQGS